MTASQLQLQFIKFCQIHELGSLIINSTFDTLLAYDAAIIGGDGEPTDGSGDVNMQRNGGILLAFQKVTWKSF